MIYKLSEPFDKERFKIRCNKLFANGSIVEMTEKTARTPKQNRYLHLIIGFLAIETGNTIEYVKANYYKIASNSDLYVRSKIDKLTNIETQYLRSSKELTKPEMTLSIERFRNWSSEQGYYLPSANETDFLMHIQYEIDKQKQYL